MLLFSNNFVTENELSSVTGGKIQRIHRNHYLGIVFVSSCVRKHWIPSHEQVESKKVMCAKPTHCQYSRRWLRSHALLVLVYRIWEFDDFNRRQQTAWYGVYAIHVSSMCDVRACMSVYKHWPLTCFVELPFQVAYTHISHSHRSSSKHSSLTRSHTSASHARCSHCANTNNAERAPSESNEWWNRMEWNEVERSASTYGIHSLTHTHSVPYLSNSKSFYIYCHRHRGICVGVYLKFERNPSVHLSVYVCLRSAIRCT